MRAVVLEGIGGPENLSLRELPAPIAEEGQVIVEVKASAINFLEVLIRQGVYPQMPELPWVPGVEIAGTTEDGRRVLGLLRSSGGGYAEVATLAPMEYTVFIHAAFFGLLIWGEALTWTTILGGLIIAGSGMFVVWREARVKAEARREG